MKIDRYGQAKILSQEEIQKLFKAAANQRDKTLFAVMLFTACRVREAVTLRTGDVYGRKGEPHPQLIIRKSNTKGKLDTREIPILEDLRIILKAYYPYIRRDVFLFPAAKASSKGYLHWDTAQEIVRRSCKKAGIFGASSHSFRRTALTQMSNAGIPLRIIQEISGHRNLEQLQRYLEVTDEQIKGAINSLSLLSPIEIDKKTVIYIYHDQQQLTTKKDPQPEDLKENIKLELD